MCASTAKIIRRFSVVPGPFVPSLLTCHSCWLSPSVILKGRQSSSGERAAYRRSSVFPPCAAAAALREGASPSAQSGLPRPAVLHLTLRHQPMSQPPEPPRGYVPEEAYMKALGEAIAMWQAVESTLCRVYVDLVQPRDWLSTSKGFFAVQNFRDKLGMVSAVAEDIAARLVANGTPWDMAAEWDALKTKVHKASLRRNKMAHLNVWVSPGHGAYGHKPIIFAYDLPIEWPKRKKLVTTLKHLTDWCETFRRTALELEAFAIRLRERPPSLNKISDSRKGPSIPSTSLSSKQTSSKPFSTCVPHRRSA